MQIFKTELFKKYQKKEGISDEALKKAANEMQSGLYDANLGGYVFKKRIAKPGQGKSGSTRSIIAYKLKNRLIFMFGFPKNKVENITDEELRHLKKLAQVLLELDESQIDDAIQEGKLQEIDHD